MLVLTRCPLANTLGTKCQSPGSSDSALKTNKMGPRWHLLWFLAMVVAQIKKKRRTSVEIIGGERKEIEWDDDEEGGGGWEKWWGYLFPLLRE